MLTWLCLWFICRVIASVHGCNIGPQCDELGGKLIGSVCYVYDDVPKTWDSAMQSCISSAPNGAFGHLAWLLNEDVYGSHFDRYGWIGLRQRFGLGTRFDLFWNNATNSPVIPIGFGPETIANGTIKYNTIKDCFYIRGNKYYVADNCTNHRKSYCQYECIPADKSSFITGSTANERCQNYCAWIGGSYSSGSCFFLEKKGLKSWDNAMYSCSLAGAEAEGVGRLSWIPDLPTWDLVWGQVNLLESDDKSAWIGLGKKELGDSFTVLRWYATACAFDSQKINASTAFINMDKAHQKCMAAALVLSMGGRGWHDRDCHTLYPFMCEIDCTAAITPDAEDSCKSPVLENCGSCTETGMCAEKHTAISTHQQMNDVCNVRSKSNQQIGTLPVVNSVEDHDAIQELATALEMTVIPLALYVQDDLFYWRLSSGKLVGHSYDGLSMPAKNEDLCYNLNVLTDHVIGQACNVKRQSGFLCQTNCALPTTTTTTTTTTVSTTAVITTTAAAKVTKAKKNLLSKTEKMVVAALQSIGCTFIISSLSVTIVIFIMLRDFSVERCIQMSYEIATLCGHILVLTVRDITDRTTECVLAGIGFHYFFLTSFVFLLLESVQTYAILTNVISFGGFMSRKMNLLVGWFLAPIPIVAIGIVVGYSGYNSEYSCWLNFGHSEVVATVIGPIFLIGWSTVILTEAASQKNYKRLPDGDKHQRLAATVNHKGILFVTFTSVAAWFVGAFAVYHVKVHLYSVVTLLNMILGIVVFLFHALGNQEAHKLIMKLINKIRGNTPAINNKQSKRNDDIRTSPDTELSHVTRRPGKGAWINDFFKS